MGEWRLSAGREAYPRGTGRGAACWEGLDVGKADAAKGAGDIVAIVSVGTRKVLYLMHLKSYWNW
jgi:hypothetical protein